MPSLVGQAERVRKGGCQVEVTSRRDGPNESAFEASRRTSSVVVRVSTTANADTSERKTYLRCRPS